MNKKRRINKITEDLSNIEKFNGCFEKLGEPNQVVVLEDFINSQSNNTEHDLHNRKRTNLSEKMEKEFEKLCLQGMLILPEDILQLPIDQRDLYIRSLLNNFKAMESMNQVSSNVVYYINKQCSYGDCLADSKSGVTSFRDKCIDMFKSYWYEPGDEIPIVESYKVKKNKLTVENDSSIEDEIEAEVNSIMKINATKKKKNDLKITDGILTPEQRLTIGDNMLNENYGLNLTDDPTKPGIWYNPFMDDVNDLEARIKTKDVNGNDFDYNNRRIDYRYIPDWHWQRWFVKPFKGCLKIEWTKIDNNINGIPQIKSLISGGYFDSHPNEVMASEFLSNAEESITNATMELAKKLTREKKDIIAGSGKIEGIPEEGWTKEFIDSLKAKGFGRADRYINYCDMNAKHAYQDERISLKRRKELEGFDLMRSTPSNCNTAKSFILAHRQLLKGATLVFENGREFDDSPWGEFDPMFFDKVKNPLGFESGFELYLGICSGMAKYQGVKVPRYAGKSLVLGSSPFNKIKKLQRELDESTSKKERKKIKKKIKKAESNAFKQIQAGNANGVITYEKSADWQDVYQFIPADFVDAILDTSIDVDQFIQEYRENERKKYDPKYLPEVYDSQFFENVNPTAWITPSIRHKMHTVLVDSMLPEFQKTDGAKIINQMEKTVIGDGKDPDTLQLIAKFNKSRMSDDKTIRSSAEYRWATEVSATYHGTLSGMVRRGADKEIIPALMGVYKMAKHEFSIAGLIGDKPDEKTIGDYALEMLIKRGIIPEIEDDYVSDEDLMGANSHFIEAYQDYDKSISEKINDTSDELSTFTSTKKKNTGDKQAKKRRYQKAKEFDDMFSSDCVGGGIKVDNKLITNVMYYTNLTHCANEDIDNFINLRNKVALEIADHVGRGQNIPNYFKQKVKNHEYESKNYSKKKRKANQQQIIKNRKKALEEGNINPLEFIESLLIEDSAAQKTKKGRKAKKEAMAKTMTARAAGLTTWEELQDEFNNSNVKF